MQQDPVQVGDLSATCLTNYLAQTEVDWDLYWLYHPVAPGAQAQRVDRCKVFTCPNVVNVFYHSTTTAQLW